MDLTLIECTDKARWNRFVEESPHGSVFCFTPFLDGLGEDYCLLLIEESGQPLGGVVLLLRDGQPDSGDYPFALYQGVLLSPSLCDEPPHNRARPILQVLDFFLAELAKRYDRISLCLHHHFDDLRGFSWFHAREPQRGRFRIELKYSGLLDLSQVADFDRYLHSIRNVRRREYQRSQSQGFCIRSSGDLDTLLRLHHQTF